jgi:hypothetical protein
MVMLAMSLWYNVSVFKRGFPSARHRHPTTLELRTLLRERVRVRKLSVSPRVSHHQEQNPDH